MQGQGSATSTHGFTSDTKGVSGSIYKKAHQISAIDHGLDSYPRIGRDKSNREKRKTTNVRSSSGPGSYDLDITKR